VGSQAETMDNANKLGQLAQSIYKEKDQEIK
jgi:hypothetical protein